MNHHVLFGLRSHKLCLFRQNLGCSRFFANRIVQYVFQSHPVCLSRREISRVTSHSKLICDIHNAALSGRRDDGATFTQHLGFSNGRHTVLVSPFIPHRYFHQSSRVYSLSSAGTTTTGTTKSTPSPPPRKYRYSYKVIVVWYLNRLTAPQP